MDPMQPQMQQQPAVVPMPMAMPPRESYPQHQMAQYSQPQQQHQPQHQPQQQQQQPQQQQPPSYVSSGYGAPPQQQAAPTMIMAPMPRLPGQTVPTSVTPAPPQGSAVDGMASWYQQNQLSQIAAVTNAATNSTAGGSSNKPIPVDFTGELKSVKEILSPEMTLLLQYIATFVGNTSLAKHGTTLTEIYIHHDLMGEDKAFRFQKLFYLYQEKYPIYKNELLCGWLVAALGMAVFQGNTKMLDFGVKQTVIALGVDPMYATSHNNSTSTQGMSRAVATMLKDRMAAQAKARAEAELAKSNSTETATEGGTAGAEGTADAAVAEASTSSTNATKRSADDSEVTVSANKRPKTEFLGEDGAVPAAVNVPVEKSTRQKVREAIAAIESDSACSQVARDLADVAKLILKTDIRVPDQDIYEAALNRALDQHPMKQCPEFEQWDLALNVGSIIHKMSPALLALNYMTLSRQSLKRYGPDVNTNLSACSVRFSRPVMAPVSLMGTGYQTIVMNNTGGLGSMIGHAMSLTGNPSVVLGTPLKAVMTNLITEETQVRAPGEKLKNEADSTVVLAIIKSASAYARTDGSVDLRAYAEKTMFYNVDSIQSRVDMGPHEKLRRDEYNLDIHKWNIRCSEKDLPVADLYGVADIDTTTVQNYMLLIKDGKFSAFVTPIYKEYLKDAQRMLAERGANLEPGTMPRSGKSGRRYDASAESSYKFIYGKKARN